MTPVTVQDAPVSGKAMGMLVGAAGVKTLADLVTLASVAMAIPDNVDELVMQSQGGATCWTDNGVNPATGNGKGILIVDGRDFKYPGHRNQWASIKFYIPAATYVVLWFGSKANHPTS